MSCSVTWKRRATPAARSWWVLATSGAPTWRETGACIDHLRGRGRLSLVSGIDDDGVTVGWGPRETPHVFLTVTNPSVHQAVADLCRMLLGDSSPP